MRADSGLPIEELRVDGGASASNMLLQFQADLLSVSVQRPTVVETTALGAGYLAGLATGVWKSLDELEANRGIDRTFEPDMSENERKTLIRGLDSRGGTGRQLD